MHQLLFRTYQFYCLTKKKLFIFNLLTIKLYIVTLQVVMSRIYIVYIHRHSANFYVFHFTKNKKLNCFSRPQVIYLNRQYNTKITFYTHLPIYIYMQVHSSQNNIYGM